MHFFSSPTSNILPSTFAPASVAMSRSDSRDSATSNASSTAHCAWDMRPRSSPAFSSQPSPHNSHKHTHRRTSSCSSSSSSSATAAWTPSPYRSCLSQIEDSSSSYLSDDDLLDIPNLDVDLIDSPIQKELSTEEQIEMLRAYREREESSRLHHHAAFHAAKPELWHRQQQLQHQQKKTRAVRFAVEQGARSSAGRRRSSALRRS